MAAPRKNGKNKLPGVPSNPVTNPPTPHDVANYKADMQSALIPMVGLTQATEQDITGMARAQLGQPQAALMMARNDIQAANLARLQPALEAVAGAERDVQTQAMGVMGDVIATAQSADPAFPGALQIAQQIYPQAAAGTFAGPDPNCLAQVAGAAMTGQQSCAASNPLGGQGYADCIAGVQAGTAQGTTACNQGSPGGFTVSGGSGGSNKPAGGSGGGGTAGQTGGASGPPVNPPAVPGGPTFQEVYFPQNPNPLLPGCPPDQYHDKTGACVPLPQWVLDERGGYTTPAPTPFPSPPQPATSTGIGKAGPEIVKPPRPAPRPTPQPIPPAPGQGGGSGGGSAGGVVQPPQGGVQPGPIPGPGETSPPVSTPSQGGPAAPESGLANVPSAGTLPTNPIPTPQQLLDADFQGMLNIVDQLGRQPGGATNEEMAAAVQAATGRDTYVTDQNTACQPGYQGMLGAHWYGEDDPANICVQITQPTGGIVNQPPGFFPTAPNTRAVESVCTLPPSFAISDWDISRFLSVMIGLRTPDGKAVEQTEGDGDNKKSNYVYNLIAGFFRNATDEVSTIIAKLIGGQGCNDPNYIRYQLTRMVADFVSKWVGDGLEAMGQRNTQAARNLCPSMLPSPDNAIEAYLANQIDLATALCWSRAGNQTENEWRRMIDARRSRLDTNSALVAWRRGLINDNDIVTYLRGLGYTDLTDIAILGKLTEQVPPSSDLVTFMTRDVEDNNIVQRFGLDADFNLKFADKVKEWAYQQGVSEEYMRRVWRAHWSIPSPTQLFEFWHKLRHDPKYNANGELEADVKQALEQQDILPFWIPRYLDSSYRVPTRVDTRRMFNNGDISRDQVFLIYTQGGYSDPVAESLTKFAESERRKAWLKRPEVKQYATGLISRAELQRLLTAAGVDAPTVQAAIDKGDWDRKIERRKQCHAAWRKRYLSGELSRDEVLKNLIQDGLDVGAATEITEGWSCEKKQRTKTIPAAEACRLYTEGIITEADYFTRLTNVGYSSKDAVAILADCNLKLMAKRTAAQEKEMKRLTAAQKKLEQAAKQSVAQQEKVATQQRQALDKARSLAKVRRNLVLEAAFALSPKLEIDPGDAVELVEATARLVGERTAVPYDTILQAGPDVAKAAAVTDAASLANHWTAVSTSVAPISGNP